MGPATLAAVLTIVAAPSRAQPPAVAKAALADVDRVFSRWSGTELPGCTIGIARDGETLLSRAYGMADLERGVANRPDTILEAGSVSKQFTAAAVLLLAQEGRIDLDDPIRKYVPELPDLGPITIRHMIHHTSGLRDWGQLERIAGWPRTTRVYTHDHVLDILSRQRSLNFPPGKRYSYTNSGYNLQAILVSRVSGLSFAEYTKDRLFAPLGMTRTSWRDDHTRVVRDRAIAYAVTPAGVASTNMPFENVHGNGGLLTTVGDLLKWNENFVHARVGGRPFVDAQLEKGRLQDGSAISYAAGLDVGEWRGVREVSHTGGTAGYRAWLARYPDSGLSVAVLCNAGDAAAWTLGRQVTELYLGLPVAPPDEAPTPDAARWSSIVGLYRDRDTGQALSIDLDGGRPRLGGVGPLTPLSPDFFRVGTGTSRLRIERQREAVRGARLVSGGATTVFDRVDRGKPSPADLAAYAGEYASEEIETTVRVVAEPDGLVLRRRPYEKIALTPTYPDGFEGTIGSVRFLRDAQGAVRELSVGIDRVFDLRFARRP